MSFYWSLPESLQVGAYVADGDYAWRADAAQRVIDCLTDRCVAVIGIDVWLATEPGPTIPMPVVYAWEARPREPSEGWLDFVTRANREAAHYINEFSWHPSDRTHAGETPYFNFTTVGACEDC